MVGWFRVGEEWRSVFPPGSADPMVGVVASCANLCVRLASSSRFDFGSRGGACLAQVVKILDLDLFQN